VGFIPANGSHLIIINNDGSDPVSGTFAQGGTITLGGVVFAINYAGGDANDVALDVVQPTTVYVDDTWTGTAVGTNPANDPIGGLVFGYNAFADIQSAINQVATGGTVVVFGGFYAAPVNVNKALSAIQASTNSTTSTQDAVNITGPVTLTNDA